MGTTKATPQVTIKTSLGSDLFQFETMQGSEGLSVPSVYEVDVVSAKGDVKADKLLGTIVTITLLNGNASKRYFTGVLTGFSVLGKTLRQYRYRLTVRSWLWLLTRGSDCRIFQEKGLVDVIKAVFSAYSQADVDTSRLSGRYSPMPYCVQYRESDFAFVSRLLEAEGIYYFFRCDNGRNTLVLADSYSSHAKAPSNASLAYRPSEGNVPAHADDVHAWARTAEIQTGSMTFIDWDYENPKGNLEVRSTHARKHAQSKVAAYDYPGGYAVRKRGESLVRVRLEARQAAHDLAHALTGARGVTPGFLISLNQHPISDQNGEYLVVAASYRINEQPDDPQVKDGPSLMQCEFVALPKGAIFRPPQVTPRPLVHGPQTARVVGKAGEEIWTDKFGRIKVQFHWDRLGKKDEKSSCWVRVAQGLAGKRWGMHFLPRIGQEVVVSFLEGDPDRPLVTGSVYNGENQPPYTLPEHATRSTLKSNTSKGGGGYNELRFEDKKGKEQVYLRAERDTDTWVKNDARTWIGRERHEFVKGPSFEEVTAESHALYGADRLEKVTASKSLTVGKDSHNKVGGLFALEAAREIHLKSKANLIIEAGASITLKAGGASIVIGPTAVSVTGAPVQLNSGGKPKKGSPAAPKAPKKPKPADDGKK